MKTLSSPVTSQAALTAQAWLEVYDIYLRAEITTPWGTISTLRLCTLPGGFAFFAPTLWPEPEGTRGEAQSYQFWPLIRDQVQATRQDANDRMTFTASNVTTEFAAMLAEVNWTDTPVVIRLVPQVSPITSSDSGMIFSGRICAAKINAKAIQFTCSSDLDMLKTVFPRETMHAACRFTWGDDLCTELALDGGNYRAKTAGASCTTSILRSGDLTEDTNAGPYESVVVTASASTDKISLYAHGLEDGDRVMFGGTAVPGGLTAGAWYFVVAATGNDFKVSLTNGGAALDLTTNGTSVTMRSESPPWGPDWIGTLAAGSVTGAGGDTGLGNVRAGQTGQWIWSVSGYSGPIYSTANTPYTVSGYRTMRWDQLGYNVLFSPCIKFDLGAAGMMKRWRLRMPATTNRSDMPCMAAIFSAAADGTYGWVLNRWLRVNPDPTGWTDVVNHGSQYHRYWAVCIRNLYGPSPHGFGWSRVSAYAQNLNYWQDGSVTFDAGTATAGLRGLSRNVQSSFSGKLYLVDPLPVAPAAGDTFVIRRGCGRLFNDCAERKNTVNYGGFDELLLASTRFNTP